MQLLAFTNGPGGFTGVRIGFSTAKMLQLTLNIPLICVNALHTIAYEYRSGQLENRQYKKIVVIMDARLEEYFTQQFMVKSNKVVALNEPHLVKSDNVSNFLPKDDNFLLAGSAKFKIMYETNNNPIIRQTEDKIKSSNIALMAQEIYKNNIVSNDHEILYLRKALITKRKDTT